MGPRAALTTAQILRPGAVQRTPAEGRTSALTHPIAQIATTRCEMWAALSTSADGIAETGLWMSPVGRALGPIFFRALNQSVDATLDRLSYLRYVQ